MTTPLANPESAKSGGPMPSVDAPDDPPPATIAAFMAEIDEAAALLRRLSDVPPVPEIPFDPSWPEADPA